MCSTDWKSSLRCPNVSFVVALGVQFQMKTFIEMLFLYVLGCELCKQKKSVSLFNRRELLCANYVVCFGDTFALYNKHRSWNTIGCQRVFAIVVDQIVLFQLGHSRRCNLVLFQQFPGEHLCFFLRVPLGVTSTSTTVLISKVMNSLTFFSLYLNETINLVHFFGFKQLMQINIMYIYYINKQNML